MVPVVPSLAPRLRARPLAIVAEDDEELRRLLARKLRSRGFDVLAVGSGAQLAEVVLEHVVPPVDEDTAPAALIVSDVRMPGRTGFEVLRMLRRHDESVPVILITGFGDAAAHADARELGALLLDKPVDLDRLGDAACSAVGLPPR